ncbi:MAG TPA: hypothetical protein VMU57_19210 [Edaphobacter sp.]|uniref:hypothetical protein n=1 Tax=Edaphobacter sp. TaxID=1934404 RepID=UPI002D1B86B7|nr:hypothetical protein [Edaphobacter sp.]HUZ97037.1 hypothetical protein [Edaphobacter sp.]
MTSQNSNSKSHDISCADFQEQLPDLFASGSNGVPEDPDLVEHLKTCENCSALVRDLQYIADQASLLLQPTLEPSDNVWKRIQEGMDSDRIHADATRPK